MRERARWSYTEVLIIAVVLSVVMLRVVPRFTVAGSESRICELIDGLEQMRAQLDLYRAQHNGCFPDSSFEVFESAMTTKVGRYGPYISSIPVNPFNNLNTVRFDEEPAGAGIAGWRLDTENGLFQADDSAAHAGL
jgi:type II secretory pathway pseudopilin PulG